MHARFCVAAAIGAALAGCSGAGTDGPSATNEQAIVIRPPLPLPPQPQGVGYQGGTLIQTPQVVVVFWGPSVASQVVANAPDFYATVVNSHYVDWLDEYDTTSPAQSIHRGTFAGSYTITPASNKSPLCEDCQTGTPGEHDVGAELSHQIVDLHTLPAPGPNTIYAVHFPAGISIQYQTEASCGNFNGVHESAPTPAGSGTLYYAMLPDFFSQPVGGGNNACDYDPNLSAFQNFTVAAGHELLETITDPDDNTGWIDPTPSGAGGGEIADICSWSALIENGTVPAADSLDIYTTILSHGVPGTRYTLQRAWSQRRQECVAGPTSDLANPFDASPSTPGGADSINTFLSATNPKASPWVPFPGTFAEGPAAWATDDGGWASAYMKGDVNGDGRDDLEAAWNNGGTAFVAVREDQNGEGFAVTQNFTTGIGWNPSAQWFAADFSGDGLADVVEIEPDRQGVTMYLDWGGTLGGHLFFATTGTWPANATWVTGDFDNDGFADLATMWNNGGQLSLLVLHNNGWGFDAQDWTPTYKGEPFGGLFPSSGTLLAGDFDGDDRDDLALVYDFAGETAISAYLSSGTWFWPGAAWAGTSVGWDAQAEWAVGDYNGDGLKDIAQITGPVTNSLEIWLSSGSGTYSGAGFVRQLWGGASSPWQGPAQSVWLAGRFR
jgi:hypothetical protein